MATQLTGKGGLQFDRTINLGQILTIITLVIGIAGGVATYYASIAKIELRLDYLEAQSRGQQKVNSELTTAVWSMKQDLSVIRDRLERAVK